MIGKISNLQCQVDPMVAEETVSRGIWNTPKLRRDDYFRAVAIDRII